MTNTELIKAEYDALKKGDVALAKKLQEKRWIKAMEPYCNASPQESPSYRAAMRDAGRGHLLK